MNNAAQQTDVRTRMLTVWEVRTQQLPCACALTHILKRLEVDFAVSYQKSLMTFRFNGLQET